MELDKTDSAVLDELSQNSRQSLRQIAKKVGVSVATVLNHIKAMETNGVIKKYSTNIDYEKLGYDFQVIIDVRVQKGKLAVVEKKIAEDSNVTAVYDITGPFDTAVVARFKNRRTLDTFVKKLQAIEFVERTETKLLLNIVKEEALRF